MKRRTANRIGALLTGFYLSIMLLSGFSSASPAYADITFPETGTTLSDQHGFLTYWQSHGGLAQFGYPLSAESEEVSSTDGRTYVTQWFERNRFEYHPENSATEYKVLLSLLGRQLARGREDEGPFRPAFSSNKTNCLYFEQTQHTLCNSFRTYWDDNGGLALYGYPLSEEFEEKNATDGKMYDVQYFERNRFEYHPENAGTKYEVLLGLLGTQLGGFPVQPVPQANTAVTLQVPEQFKNSGHWATEHKLIGPEGMQVSLFGLGPSLRMMAVAPNGDLFVSSTLSGTVSVMLDRNGDGVADEMDTFAKDLPKPHGLAFHNGYLYVACEAEVLRFPYAAGQLAASGEGEKVADLPFGASQGLAHDVSHDTRSIAFGPDNKMYISIGSDCDVCEESEPRRASIMQFNDDGTAGRIYASGLRNAVGLDVDPATGLLWASVNERNGKGSDFPPDMLTTIQSNANYGWPYCLGVPLQPDPQFNKSATFCNSQTSAPIAIPAHSAPLGISFSSASAALPAAFSYGIFLATHGTSPPQGDTPALRDPPAGYNISFVSLRPGGLEQGPHIVISGWLANNTYWGRPVDVVFGKDGTMFISDDAAGAVYRVTFTDR